MKDLHILKGLVVGLKTCIIEIVQLIVKVIYYIIRKDMLYLLSIYVSFGMNSVPLRVFSTTG